MTKFSFILLFRSLLRSKKKFEIPEQRYTVSEHPGGEKKKMSHCRHANGHVSTTID